MIDKEILIGYYQKQYENEGKRKTKVYIKASGFEKRITAMGRTLKRLGPTQVSRQVLTDYHRQIKNLTHLAYKFKRWKQVDEIMSTVLPELVRLDFSMLLPEEQEMVNQDFLDYVNQGPKGQICVNSLFDLYQEYRKYSIENRITELVPTKPEMEFPKALKMHRKFILHIGPTNSGKTFQALSRLKDAKNGVYLGPLRLLALEVYEKMMEYGTPCTMLTGQECIEQPNSKVMASTIEMVDINQRYDIAVIDEAQMIADTDRGHSWTRAILGLLSEEIHICMSPAAEPVIIHLIGVCGDTYEIRRYERKTALICEDTPFNFPEDVQPGDALIVFSKKTVLDVAGRLEEVGIEASVIYGSLPPEIRRRQVQMFAEGKTDVVVATDAIGMGLNLPVRRIVFVQTEKFDGVSRRMLKVSEIKQIAGRAGRFGKYDTGYVTAMDEESLAYIRENYTAEELPIETVSLGFPQILLEMKEPLDAILKIWHDVKTAPPFEKVSIEETLFLYEKAYKHKEWIQEFNDKYMLYRMISCPIDIKDQRVVALWLKYCTTYTADVSLPYPNKADCGNHGLMRYETYYKSLDLYYQFSTRMGKVIDTKWLERERRQTENTIMRYLLKGKRSYIATCKYCGRLLPVGVAFGVCDRCHKYARRCHRETQD